MSRYNLPPCLPVKGGGGGGGPRDGGLQPPGVCFADVVRERDVLKIGGKGG
jgi:hypothetical protein